MTQNIIIPSIIKNHLNRLYKKTFKNGVTPALLDSVDFNRTKERLATIEQEQREVQERGGMRSRMKDQEYEEIDTYAEQLVQGTEKPFLMQFKVFISDTDQKKLLRRVKEFG